MTDNTDKHKDRREFNFNFSGDDIDIVKSKTVYDGFFKVRKITLKHRLFAGGWTSAIVRELFARGDAVALLPYDPINDELVLIEQFRVGALKDPYGPWQLEVIAGMVGEGEALEQVAVREAHEEANLTVSNLHSMLSYWSSPGGSDEKIHLYLAIVDVSEVGGVFGLADEDEDIKVHRFSYNQAVDMFEQGMLDNAATVIAMQWLMLNRAQLRQQYLGRSEDTQC